MRFVAILAAVSVLTSVTAGPALGTATIKQVDDQNEAVVWPQTLRRGNPHSPASAGTSGLTNSELLRL